MNKKFIIITIAFFTMVIVTMVVFVGLKPTNPIELAPPRYVRIIEKTIYCYKSGELEDDESDIKYGGFRKINNDSGQGIVIYLLNKNIKPGTLIFSCDYKFQQPNITNKKMEIESNATEFYELKVDEDKMKIEIYFKKFPPVKTKIYSIKIKNKASAQIRIEIDISQTNAQ